MRNNKGFIATSLILTFFLLFCALLLNTLRNYNFNLNLIDKLNKINFSKSDNNGDEPDVPDDGTTEWTFAYSGGSQVFRSPRQGFYKVELWGAQGGGATGGKGGYTSGEINLKKGEKFYIYVGGAGNSSGKGGYNGGGDAGVLAAKNDGGGGATDIRIVGGTWNDAISLNSRIMVAAGGGGANANGTNTAGNGKTGGAGGGSIGYPGVSTIDAMSGKGAGTTVGGASGSSGRTPGFAGSFGLGGSGKPSKKTPTLSGGAGGGGGYWGGGSGEACEGNCGGSAGGGSSFISGHTGCYAVESEYSTEARTCNIYTQAGFNECSIHYSGKYFINTIIIDGAGYKWETIKGNLEPMPDYSSDTGTYESGVGNAGNGYARITYIS